MCRAAFAGHISVCEYLLSQGADPRVYAEDGALPQHIASREDVEQLFIEWDIEETEKLLTGLSVRREEQNAVDAKHKQQEEDLVIQCMCCVCYVIFTINFITFLKSYSLF